MSIIKITEDNFETEVMISDKTVLVDFWATWCGPCAMIAPILEEIAAENDDINIAKIDVDDNPQLAAQFGIMSIPTLLVVKDGQVVNKAVGAMPKEEILALVK
ncbi:MAG: thioredoxin [Clostridia bacterium]|nr:thioredoxin [Clostridia bacterium]